MEHKFHTLKGYAILEDKKITYAMEDYLEMICRVCKTREFIRISELSERLNVRPSSVTKMVSHLKEYGLVNFERYGYIKPTEAGLVLGAYLIHRHEVLNRFLCFINSSEDELEQVEKIEHFLDEGTITNIEKIMNKYFFN